jgi:hypothetical protein
VIWSKLAGADRDLDVRRTSMAKGGPRDGQGPAVKTKPRCPKDIQANVYANKQETTKGPI